VDNPISETDDAADIRDFGGRVFIGLFKPAQGFADDFKLAFDGAAELAIAFILGKSPA
jgi:hypothetical protein